MRAVDTNVVVRLIARDEPDQVDGAEAFVRPGAWVSHVVLAEVTWVLSTAYNFHPRSIARAIEMILENPHVVVQESDVVAAALENFRQKPSVGFTDCLILEMARKAGHLPLGTFDRNLAKMDGAEAI